MAFNTSNSEPLMAQPLLDSFIPGFSLISGIFAQYFHIDISSYISSLIILLAIIVGLNHCMVILFDFFEDWLISTAEIRLDDEMYNYVMYWVSVQQFSKKLPRFIAGTKITSEILEIPGEESEGQQYDEDGDLKLADGYEYQGRLPMANRDKIKILQYTPANGTHVFRYKGRFLAFSRFRDDKQTAAWVVYSERLYISCLGRNAQILKELLEEAQHAYLERDGNNTVIYRGTHNADPEGADWVRCMSRPPRPLSTVVLDRTQKQAFIDDVEEYLHPLTRRWYSNRGIPYRRGYLFHGPPGTGKTSLCFAVAGLFGLKIYVVGLNSRTLTEEALAALFQNLPPRCIVLLEDIDSAGITHKRTGEEDAKADLTDKAKGGSDRSKNIKGISLSALLNIIDGVASSEGRILVMTTNHIEKLDRALLRPGRVDMTIGFDYTDTATVKGLFNAIYTQLESDLPRSKTELNSPAVLKHTDTEIHEHGVVAPHTEKPLSCSAYLPSRFFNEKHFQQGHPEEEIIPLASQFAGIIPDREFTPAEVQGYLLKHKSNPNAAVAGAAAWVRSVREEKEKGRAESAESGQKLDEMESGQKQRDEEEQSDEKSGSDSSSDFELP
jgi:mitochondrial chaperone BCS1